VINTRVVAITIWKTRPTATTVRREKRSAICPAGRARTRSGRNSASHEAEVEWILVDQVDLHADRDDEHLEREPARERRRP
jgi:hypothetical protein